MLQDPMRGCQVDRIVQRQLSSDSHITVIANHLVSSNAVEYALAASTAPQDFLLTCASKLARHRNTECRSFGYVICIDPLMQAQGKLADEGLCQASVICVSSV